MYPLALTKDEQKKHWYLFIMGTLEDRRRQGLGGALLVYAQDLARSDGRPLWLEATTEASRDFYTTHGFATVSEVNLGKGKVSPNGLPERDGQGITIWAMCWRPT